MDDQNWILVEKNTRTLLLTVTSELIEIGVNETTADSGDRTIAVEVTGNRQQQFDQYCVSSYGVHVKDHHNRIV